ncbi:hypothetical protein CDD81_7202 [Ophiocordyceps australis]|uniref:DHHA2 domain-containing protein n=1 Tax=Ophiocordyceps australis TaxID=1399860 RepID=A0A2C5Y3Z8_9HYPO|nr:hypothetical protein CDD81_7202 [Ophiocordyceps australis]
MPLPRVPLASFLAQATAALRAPLPSPLTFVVGNESADLDSVCAAIVYAYLSSHRAPSRLHVPLVNVQREDLAIRPELTAVLGRAGLAPDCLPTLSDLPRHVADGEPCHGVGWVLVDHNVPTGIIARAAKTLSGCIDHHDDEKVVPAAAQPRVIETCGSCTSLVVHVCADDWDALSCRDPDGDVPLAIVALAPILADTSNLEAKDLLRDKDLRAAAMLEAKLAPCHDFDRTDFFNSIKTAMGDLSSLSLADILRKDYKQWGDLGISSIGQSLSWLISKAGGHLPLLDGLAAWARHRHIKVLAIMTLHNKDGHFERQLVVWGFGPAARRTVAAFAHTAAGPLRLKPWPAEAGLDSGFDDAENLRFAWSQGNCRASRKAVAPLLRAAFTL